VVNTTLSLTSLLFRSFAHLFVFSPFDPHRIERVVETILCPRPPFRFLILEFTMVQRLKKFYLEKVFEPALSPNGAKESASGLKPRQNLHQIPRVQKIVINRGLGEASSNTKLVDASSQELTLISGQRSRVTKARKSIAGFKIREDMPVGISVTLRGDRMYAFLDRLINLALPRIRDFQGLSAQSFDGNGNYSLGLKEQLMFPELDYDKIDKSRGMDISIITTAESDQEAFLLLKALGMPFSGKI
jgi:large subunit ribosomal protein L5